MAIKRKALTALTIEDIRKNPIWEFAENSNDSEILIKPVSRIPVKRMSNRVVGTKVFLADGSAAWALIGNISTNNPLATKHFLTISIFHGGKWFDLARYHDVDYARRNESALSRHLRKDPNFVFPISYDLTELVSGLKESLRGKIPQFPDEQLSLDALIRLSLDAD